MTNTTAGQQRSIAKRYGVPESCTSVNSHQSSWTRCLPEKTGLPRLRPHRIQSSAALVLLLLPKVLGNLELLLAMCQAAALRLLSPHERHQIYLQIKRAEMKPTLHHSAKKMQIAPRTFHLLRVVATLVLAARRRQVIHLLHYHQQQLPHWVNSRTTRQQL